MADIVTGFTQEMLAWKPYIPPLAEDELTTQHRGAFKHPSNAKSEYFRLLAREPEILAARSRIDADTFYSPGGLPRAERELAAVAVSRLNGCIYCASVHARFASAYAKRKEDVDALLAQGVGVHLDERWDAIIAAAAALTATPIAFGREHAARLRNAGLSGAEIVDLLNCAAFFNWANRLMLSLGEANHIEKEKEDDII
jgi:alkylhydroperoxidase domain protein